MNDFFEMFFGGRGHSYVPRTPRTGNIVERLDVRSCLGVMSL